MSYFAGENATGVDRLPGSDPDSIPVLKPEAGFRDSFLPRPGN